VPGLVYYPYMASIVGKKRGRATYYYLVESARVDGRPRIVSQEYLGTADELAAAMRGGGLGLPDRTRHKQFGAIATAWGMLDDLGVAAVIDEVAGPRPAGQPLSTGTYLALAALNRLVAPCSKAAFADWWKTTAGDRFAKIPAAALDHRRFWDAMHAVTLEQLEEISRQIAVKIVQSAGVDVSSVALDIVVLDTPSRSNKRAATCGNATLGRSLTFQVRPRIVRHDLPPAGDWKVCGGRWGSSPGEGGSAGAFGWAA
jgi:hypothetical protein